MKCYLFTFFVAVVMLVSGCAGTTSIKNLVLPPVTAIEGTITKINDRGFTLEDSTGEILVSAKLEDNKMLKVSVGEAIKVYGNLQGGPERVFDGYVIRKTTGEQIIVSNPSPHIGCIIQRGFK